jgi:ferrous iron transport protein B
MQKSALLSITTPEGLPVKRPLQIALVGNPNTGKTTLFNALTGLRQRIGNYPGITVSLASGTVFLDKTSAYITDLPGTYSLAASSPDEKLVHDYLNGNISNTAKPDLIVVVVDASHLEKSLMLASQLAEHELPMVMALSFWDTAQRIGNRIHPALLSAKLGIPVVPINAVKGEGLAELKTAILKCQSENLRMTRIRWDREVEQSFVQLEHTLSIAGQSLKRAEAQRLVFDSTQPTLPGLSISTPLLKQAIDASRASLRRAGYHPHTAESVLHHKHLQSLLEGCVTHPENRSYRRGESIDRLLTHRVWGMGIFLFFMYLIFQAVYSWSSPFMDAIDWGKESAQNLIASQLAGMPQLQSLITDGIIEGVGAFLIFLPQILILFFFVSLLEETGYMARAAFLMDRLFSWCGLSGKSFVPLLSSFACAVPGILATRTIEDPKQRLITILIAPLMSCSARLPVYVLIIGALIEPSYGPWAAGFTLFAIHFLGIAVALPTALILHRVLKKTPSKPFIIEMPDYQIPKWNNLVYRMWNEGKEFVVRAGTIIFSITILIWALLYYPRQASVADHVQTKFANEWSDQGQSPQALEEALRDENSEAYVELEHRIDAAYLNQSLLSRLGKKIQPVFNLAGFDWRISVGILASFPAREVIVSTLGVMMSLGGDVDENSPGMRDALRSATWTVGPKTGQTLFTLPVALAIMVFFALCQQCGSTLAVIRSETHTRWAIFSFVYMTLLAWVASVATYQITSHLIS